MKDNHRKPACIFYHTQIYSRDSVTVSASRCVLKEEEDGNIKKFDIYGEWNHDKAMEFSENLHGCPFICREWENLYTNRRVREKCDKCSKRVKWTRQYKQETEAQRLEARGF